MAQASAEKMEVSGESLCFKANCKSGEYTAAPIAESSSPSILLEPSVEKEIPLTRGAANSLNLSRSQQ